MSTTQTSAEQAGPRPIRTVDPRALVVRANVRTIAEPDPELVESVRAGGIIQPPVVYADGQDLVLIAGHRRTAAAIAAGLTSIEVLLTDRPDEAGRLAMQVSENTNRAALSTREVADAVEQLALLGVPAGQIARAAGLRAQQVAAARAVAAAVDTARTAIEATPDLTLEQAAALADWGQDENAVDNLLAAAQRGQVAFEHERSRLEAKRETETQRAAAAQEWTAKGYQVFDARQLKGRTPPGGVELADLAGADGKQLGSYGWGVTDAHAECPGRGVVMASWGNGTDVREICTDPKGNAHPTYTRPGGPRGGGKPATAAGPDRATVVARNRDWKAATTVRHQHLAALIKTGKPSPATVTAVHTWLLNHRTLDIGDVFHTLTDFPRSGRLQRHAFHRVVDPGAPPHRVTALLIAAAASAAEGELDKQTWRYTGHSGADWLKLLVEHTGYQLADVERIAVAAVDKKWKPPATSARAAATPASRLPSGYKPRTRSAASPKARAGEAGS